jgi:PAS domain S-box-containing protein
MIRVLIVDDREESRYFLDSLLRGNGYEVDVACHGAEALEKARQNPPQCIISDLLMPVMDGYTLLRQWRADDRLKLIPFVVYTATYTDPKDEQLALSLGADAFILKPAEPADFIARISQVIAARAGGAAAHQTPAPVTPVRIPIAAPEEEDAKHLRQYNEVLIHKLEDKMEGLDKANRELQRDNAERKQTERHIKQLNRVYSVLSDVNETIVRETDVQAMLEAVCRIAVEQGKFRMAWVGLFTTETQMLRPVASSGVVEGYMDLVKLNLRDATTATGPAVRCILSGEHAICNDVAHDPLFLPWRDEALRRGYQSSGAFPLKIEDKVVGVYTLYADEPGFFNGDELRLLDELAMDISFAMEVGQREKERQKAEEELRWRTAFFEAQVDSALDGVLVVDSQGMKVVQNQRMNDLWKIPPHIAENKDDARQIQFVAERTKYPKQFIQKVLHLYAHPDEVSQEEIELVDGTVLDRCSSPVRDKAGRYYGRIWIFHDVTERKRSEESVARLAKAVEQSAETIIITDTRGTILYTNPAFEKTSGYTCAEALGQNPRILKSGKHDALFYRQMWNVLTQGKDWRGHFINRRKDGTLYEEDVSISPVRNVHGVIVNYVAAKRDVTREVQLEAQFRQSQKMEAVGQLAGGVAHDFNNILSIIQMQSDLLKGAGGLSAGQLEFVDEIGATVKRAGSLTRQLLLFCRKGVFEPTDLDLNQSISEMTKMLQRSMGENIHVQCKFGDEGLFVHADAGMIDQVLMNLVVNARAAMPHGGRLFIETSGVELDEFAASQSVQARPGAFVCLSVSDNGCGIPPEILPRIFEPFFTTKGGKGTGLGLATVFGIVQQHQGWINVYSEVGHGTTFRMYLPRLGNIVPRSSRTAPVVQGGDETILLVEDDPALLVSAQKCLSQLGYHVLTAATGGKALKILKQNRGEIHLLLTDLLMPGGMTGRELAQSALQENPKLKVIYMSGYSAEVLDNVFPSQEGFSFLTKPFAVSRLAQVIRENLDAKT